MMFSATADQRFNLSGRARKYHMLGEKRVRSKSEVPQPAKLETNLVSQLTNLVIR